MGENRYSLAGWLAVANAALFPLAIILNIVFSVITAKLLGFYQPTFGPGDLLGLLSTGITVYLLLKFKQLLHEHYNFREVDSLIMFSIVWMVAFQIGGLALRALQMIVGTGRDAAIFTAIVSISFLAVGMVTVGVIDVMIAIRLMKIKEQVGEAMKFFIYLTLVTGILEVTILLSPLALLLVPVVFISYAFVFFRDREQIQFV